MNQLNFLKNKKSQSLAIKSILILIISLIFVFSNIWFYISYQDFFFKDYKTKTQTFHNNLLEKCFNENEEFAIIKKDKFNLKNLKNCLELDGSYLYLELDGTKIFYPSKNEFESKFNFCNLDKTSLYCTEQIFPVKIKETNEIKKLKTIIII